MHLKRIICLWLFLFPVLWMLAILYNYHSPAESVIINKDGTVKVISTVDSKNGVSKKLLDNFRTDDPTKNADNSKSNNNNTVWITRKVNNIASTYSLREDFWWCDVSKNVSDAVNAGIVAPLAEISRIDFLQILLDTHCIEYNGIDTSDLEFSDIGKSNVQRREIIKKAIDMNITQWYDLGGTTVFRPNRKISKIEALAMLMKLSWLELKEAPEKNNFVDVENNWKENIADTAYRLGLTPVDRSKKMFFPDYIMKRWDSYDIIWKIAKYY